jgi:hypothetical protein
MLLFGFAAVPPPPLPSSPPPPLPSSSSFFLLSFNWIKNWLIPLCVIPTLCVFSGHAQIVHLLLERNKSGTIPSDSQGATPLHYAAQSNFAVSYDSPFS